MAGAFSGHDDCCPLVVDPLTYIALLSFLVAATYFLWVAVTMNIMGRKRRKRSVSEHVYDLFYAGMIQFEFFVLITRNRNRNLENICVSFTIALTLS